MYNLGLYCQFKPIISRAILTISIATYPRVCTSSVECVWSYVWSKTLRNLIIFCTSFTKTGILSDTFHTVQ